MKKQTVTQPAATEARKTYSNIEVMIADISPALRRYAARYSGSAYDNDLAAMTQDAQELFQQAMTMIVKQFEPGNTLAYYKKLANWTMLNQTKSTGVYFRHVGSEEDMGTAEDLSDNEVLDRIVAYDVSPEDTLIQHENAEKFQRIVSTLPAEQALIIRLMAEGFDMQAISCKLGIQYNTCWKRVAKVRETFQAAGISAQMA